MGASVVCGPRLARGAHVRIQFQGQSWTKQEPFAHSQNEIQRALADVTISRDAADWLDIKDLIHNVIHVGMSPKTRQQYGEMEK